MNLNARVRRRFSHIHDHARRRRSTDHPEPPPHPAAPARTAAPAAAAIPGDTRPATGRRHGRTWRWILGAHAALVVGLLLLFLLVAELASPTDGANIGAGILLLPLLPLGLPWSLPVILDPYRFDSAAQTFGYALYWGPALLNVAIDGLLWVVCSRLRTQHRPRIELGDGLGR
ncbi:hypothetical protein [Rhodococcus sp. WAY2]|uniref:hypothetical protein n=1 Tax=Rhodococcus sp. WAY2 TaxID=2663121 RepID=UPI00131F87EB|nr:hypothetical protein [Rhodococcus sp. WAY2]QHE72741.1 hypothetical protein GFS60_06389 [Rhodococcus sp. WAY2]